MKNPGSDIVFACREPIFLFGDTFEKMSHFLNSLGLGGNNGLQDRCKAGTDIETKGIFTKSDGALVMGDHFPDKICADVVV